MQLAVVPVSAEDERTEGALFLAEAERGDDQVGRADALDLHHALALARHVRALGLLRDAALRQARQPLACRVPVVGCGGDLDRLADRLLQALAALAVRQFAERLVAL